MNTYGPAYEQSIDGERISKQHSAIRDLMLDGEWRTLSEISDFLHYPESSVSAQLRHLRKVQFGSYTVNKRRRKGAVGTWEYQVCSPNPIRLIDIKTGQKEMFDLSGMRGH